MRVRVASGKFGRISLNSGYACSADGWAPSPYSVTSTGKKVGTLTTFGNGMFDGTFFGPDGTLIPTDITVTSSLGGSATSAVTLVPKRY